jgi:hypothetical protein
MDMMIALSFVVLIGLGSLGVALGLMGFDRYVTAYVR